MPHNMGHKTISDGLTKRRVSRKRWTKLQQKSVKGIGVEPHHCDEYFIVSRCKKFSPWGQLQQDQSTSKNLPLLMTLLLNWQGFPKVLFIPGVLPLWCPLLLLLTKGKREEEKLLWEMHCQDNNAMVDAVVIAEVIFWMFLSSTNFQSQTNYVFVNHKHTTCFGTKNLCVTNTYHLCAC